MKGQEGNRRPRQRLILLLALGVLLLGKAAVLEATAIVFPEMSGWKQAEKTQRFSPRTLYEYINGAADLYLAYEFQELHVAEYRRGPKAVVTVEVYRHQNSTQAFGIYSQERLPDARLVDIGAQGYQEPMVLNFITGPYYVKINGYETGPEDEKILLAFAQRIGTMLGGKTPLPGILSSFPREGEKRNSEKFISKNFLGYSFFHSGYTADYDLSGRKFKIFVIEGRDAEDSRGMMEKYVEKIGGEKKISEGRHRMKDPYHGEVDIFWKGKFIWGILDLKDPDLRARYLQEVEARSTGPAK
jgi:hypothetical protein